MPVNNIKTKTVDIKKTNTLENKHRQKLKEIETDKSSFDTLQNELLNIITEINNMDKNRSKFTNNDLDKRAKLLDQKDHIENKISLLSNNIIEMDYYDQAGDLIVNYYNCVNIDDDNNVNDSKNILSFLCKKKTSDDKPKEIKVNKTDLFEKYC